MYMYGQIALTIARAIILAMQTRTNKSTDYFLNCTLKCVINYTNIIVSVYSHGRLELKLIESIIHQYILYIYMYIYVYI